jgi:hypothetical protein
MANRRTKGKIPHGEWPHIVAKYAGGETIAQIGRDYGCTAPAIRYIIGRSAGLKSESGSEDSRARTPNSGASGGREKRTSVTVPRAHAPAGSRAKASVLAPQLLTRVTDDVVSFLAALDHAVLEGSPESFGALQSAIDALMRSAARTRIELGRIANPDKAAVRQGDVAQADGSLRASE